MIVIDTSIWIEYFRNRDPHLVDQLENLITERKIRNLPIITAELIRGCRHAKEIKIIRETIGEIPHFAIENSDWEKIAIFSYHLARKGLSVGLIDAAIAVLCIENDCGLWTKDQDFVRIARFSSLKIF